MCRARASDAGWWASAESMPAPPGWPVDAPTVLVDAPPVAVGDLEREAASSELRLHFTDGRLDVDEFSRRLDEVWRAETAADLQEALRQLPPIPGRPRPWAGSGMAPAQAGWASPTRPAPGYRGRPAWVSVVLAIAAVWVALALWPLWLAALVVWLVFIRPRHRHRYSYWYV
jgi:hypothetical protein